MRAKMISLVLLVVLVSAACTPSRDVDSTTDPGTPSHQSDTVGQQTGTNGIVTTPGTSGALLARPGSIARPIDLPRELWRYTATAPTTASPVTAAGIVVAGFADFTFRGLRATDGAELWVSGSSAVPVSVAAADSGLFAADLQTISRLSIQDGSVHWTTAIDVAAGARILATSRAVYVPTADGRIAAVSVGTGERLWTADLDPASDAPVVGAVKAFDGVLYAGTADGAVAAVFATDGAARWLARLGALCSSGPTVTAEGVVVAASDGTVFLIALDTGERVPIGAVSEPVVSAAILPNRSLFVFGAAGGLFLLDPEPRPVDSSRVVIKPVDPISRGGSDLAGQPALLDSRILVADATGRLRGLDAVTGSEIWATQLHLRMVGEMAFNGEAVFVAGAAGEVLALVFDVPSDSTPLLSDGRLWDVPEEGQFRMATRFVEFRFMSEYSGVVEWVVRSSRPDDELVVTILDDRGNVLATNMGKVVLERSTRASVVAGREFHLRVERSYPDSQVIVTLLSQVIQ